ncbi:MAG: SgcJ/EcaC family oxidoreductase [Chloroflexi bacterium]|nr:SgcJ/EcaC family oxidoreductase [Chloroflexota bacterium]
MQTAEEQSIIKETEAFAEVWSKGDAKAAASFYTEDATRVGAFGDVQHGLAEIEAAYDKLLHQTMPGAKVKQERGSVRFLSSRLAVWQGGIEIIPPSGGPSLKGHVVQVMKKVKGRWLIFEAHPKIFPPPPATR